MNPTDLNLGSSPFSIHPSSSISVSVIWPETEMSPTPLQVCMDSSHWLEGYDSLGGMDSSSSPPGDHHHHMLGCSRPIMERRLRPQHDQPLKCPRCEYWTKGGTLRNIPVGGGCRKSKKAASSKKQMLDHPMLVHNQGSSSSSSSSRLNLHLSLPHDLQLTSPQFTGSLLETGPFPSINNFLAGPNCSNTNLSQGNYDTMAGDNNPLEQVQLGVLGGGGFGDLSITDFGPSFHRLCSDYSIISSSTDGVHNFGEHFMDNNNSYQSAISMDVKPNPRLLSLDWQEDDSSEAGRSNINATFGGYSFNGMGSSWTGMVMNEYGSSTASPLV
ncbi:hypothetical protein SAY86_031934 [Trapa natans]|uniref:Dof-type domain-containing protein n=1 Tax=Trapa natans TaxID=22666 RepID=A0AAN7R8S6_TRANT|nr:hypothetical protein SAY86_031934 [Trapa natans]